MPDFRFARRVRVMRDLFQSAYSFAYIMRCFTFVRAPTCTFDSNSTHARLPYARCPKPVICAVHSACVGGGVDLVCATDIRLASSDAWFSIKEVRFAYFE